MAGDFYADLAWLPRPPVDFRQRCRALAASPGASGRDVRSLATFALNESQLARLSATIGELARGGADLASLTPLKLGILGNGTLDLIAPALIASAARHGVLLELVQAEFGQTLQEALDPQSRINRARPD